MLVVASANSLAMTLASGAAGANNENEMFGELPMTIATAIVSPSARPSPRMIAPTTPEIDGGNTDSRTISHLVAPSASAASRWLCGTTAKTSVQTDEIYGITITARMTPAENILTEVRGP